MIPFEHVKHLLKLSKSGPKDEGPYSIQQDAGWFSIVAANGTVVGQKAGKAVITPDAVVVEVYSP